MFHPTHQPRASPLSAGTRACGTGLPSLGLLRKPNLGQHGRHGGAISTTKGRAAHTAIVLAGKPCKYSANSDDWILAGRRSLDFSRFVVQRDLLDQVVQFGNTLVELAFRARLPQRVFGLVKLRK